MFAEKIARLLRRLAEVEEALAKPGAYEDAKTYRSLTQEHAYLSEIKNVHEKIKKSENSLLSDQNLLKNESDPEMQALLHEEIGVLEKKISNLKRELETLLVPPDPDDDRNVIMELRAGAGGDEAAIFVGDCVRMYQLYAAKKGWRHETLSYSESDLGGFREYIMVLSGSKVKRLIQYEAGTHRVQRVPETEAQGRIHTSTITVAILLEPTEEEEVKIEQKDIRIDTFRASGAGGQHVNVTDSAVRITHLPTGIVVSCQDERSQVQNREKAFRILKAKIADEERKKREQEEAAKRQAQVGSGDRSERIRTYNFPQNRVTDHRIHLTLHNLNQVMEGELDAITQALVTYFYQSEDNLRDSAAI